MIKKLVLLIIAGLSLAAGIGYFFGYDIGFEKAVRQETSQPSSASQPASPEQEEDIDHTASFAIFTNGTFRVFSAAMYHNLSESAYITAENPNIVHVKAARITWGDFFETLPFNLTPECLTTGTGQTFCTNETGKLSFYLNNEETPNLLAQEIKPNDKALVTYGSVIDVPNQLQQIP